MRGDLKGQIEIGPSLNRRQSASQIRRQREFRSQPLRIGTMPRSLRTTLLLSRSASLLLGLGNPAMSQTAAPAAGGTTKLPEITVNAPRVSQQPRRPKTRVTTGIRREVPAAPPQTEAQIVAGKNEKFDEARQNIGAPCGATWYQINHQAIEARHKG